VPVDGNPAPVIIDGHIIPQGSRVGVNIYAIHHNEAYFLDPFVFKPERWTDDAISAESRKIMHDAFTPFSIGYRSCAGKSMAYLESSMAVARALWFLDFEPASVQSGASGREDTVFQSKDQFGSWHTGPNLKFHLRDNTWAELFDEKETEG
jgi:cytochrome P450